MPVIQGIPFLVHPAQTRFLKSTARIRGYVGGRGAGKTRIGAYDLIRRAKADRHYLFLSPTYPQLRETSLRTFLEVASTVGGRIVKMDRNDATLQVSCVEGGKASITYRSTERAEQLRGPNYSGVWWDEASLSHEDAFDVILGSLREGGEMGWISLTFTPKGRQHWTYELFHDPSVPSTELIHSTSHDNPWLPREYIATLEGRYRPDKAAQEIEGRFLDLSDQLISYELMMNCTVDNTLWKDGLARSRAGLLYIGWDIARSRDRSVIWTWERVGDVAWCRECYVMHNVSYEEQEAQVMKRVIGPNVARVVIDEGFGGALVERLQRQLGNRKVEGLALTGYTQAMLAESLADAIGRRVVRLPDDNEIRDDFAQVGQTEIKNGKAFLAAESVARTDIGHADRFWAAALAYKGLANHVYVPVVTQFRPRVFKRFG